jgi:hypothetical protein
MFLHFGEFAAIALLAIQSHPARTQSLARPAASNSARTLREAHGAQREFELTRRAHLPVELAAGSSHWCEVRIGRYCYWYDPAPDRPPPDPEIVREARQQLLRDLAGAAARLPGDDWIAGQLVHYLAEQGYADSAVIAARRCEATRWWCDALEGFARHLAGDYRGADDAFGRALREMPEAERCAWTDLGTLLRDGGRGYHRLRCAEREVANQRIWWLAQPLYSRPGNDLRTEHFARHTMARLLEDAETPDAVPWGADTRELVVRFGWPTHWSRAPDRPGELALPPILGHEPGPSFWLLPEPAVQEPWEEPTEVRWNPSMGRPPTRYAPAYAGGFDVIDRVQFARFRRADTSLTVAAYDLTPDSVLGTRGVDLRLVAGRDASTPVALASVSAAKPRGVVSVRSAWRPAVLSLEALGMDTSWVARRRAVAPPDPAGLPPDLSDILLFAPGHELPASLDAALTLALPAPAVRRGQRLGLYWEMYEPPDSTVAFEIGVRTMKSRPSDAEPYPVGRPWCPLSAASPVALRWREAPERGRRDAGRAVTLDLRSLRPGRYVVTVQASEGARIRGCSSREIRVSG